MLKDPDIHTHTYTYVHKLSLFCRTPLRVLSLGRSCNLWRSFVSFVKWHRVIQVFSSSQYNNPLRTEDTPHPSTLQGFGFVRRVTSKSVIWTTLFKEALSIHWLELHVSSVLTLPCTSTWGFLGVVVVFDSTTVPLYSLGELNLAQYARLVYKWSLKRFIRQVSQSLSVLGFYDVGLVTRLILVHRFPGGHRCRHIFV